MPSTTFIDGTTVIQANWLNDVNAFVYGPTVITGGSINGVPIGGTTPSTGAFTGLSASGVIAGTSFTGAGTGLTGTASALSIGGNAASLTTARTIGGSSFNGTADVTSFPVPGPIGGTTPSTGAFTNLSVSRSVTLGSVGLSGQVSHKNDAGVLAWVSGMLGNTGQTRYSIYNLIIGREDFCVDAAGNVGIGVTPSAWDGYRSVQIGLGAAVSSSAVGSAVFSQGSYNPNGSGWRYVYGETAVTNYEQYLGAHYWSAAPPGTAGDPITFTQAMTLDVSGRLLVPNGTVVAPVAFASLPASPVPGQRAMINNSVAAPAFLSAAAGGGAVTVPVFYNGSAWLVG